ncbi:MAG: hypothetical protein JXI33_00640 [Candidatus Aminicenantes bacterium]|nr:hypothetical protein [Candidatus Aminicenantes bacterium]
MKVQLTPAVLQGITVLRSSGYKGAGFLLGSTIGRFIIIEQLLPLDFNRDSVNNIYRSVCASYQQRLQGVFFCRRRPFATDWFLYDLVLVIGHDHIEVCGCEFSEKKRKTVLVPLLEDTEDAWPN